MGEGTEGEGKRGRWYCGGGMREAGRAGRDKKKKKGRRGTRSKRKGSQESELCLTGPSF